MKQVVQRLFLLLCLTCSLLTGCGSGATSDAADAPLSPEEHPTLVYWSMWESHEPQAHVIQSAVDDFTKETGIPVEIRFMGRSGNRAPLKEALENGTVVDLFDEDIDRVPIDYADYLLDLEELCRTYHYEDTALPSLMSACREVGGGRLTSIPYQPNIFAIFYNQDLFDQVRIREVPQTWEEFLTVCQTLKTHNITPFTIDDAYISSLFGYHLGRLVGEERVREIVQNNQWDDPAVLRTAEDLYLMVKRGYFSPKVRINQFPEAQNKELATGKAAMSLNGSWVINETAPITGPGFRWGCFSYPVPEGSVNGQETSNYGAQVFGIHKRSPFPDACFQLITKLTKGYYDARLSEDSLGIPADLDNPMWPDELQCVSPVVESMTVRWSWAAGAESNSAMIGPLRDRMQQLCAGRLTPEEFVQALMEDARHQEAAAAPSASVPSHS